jgi:glycerophosphoryl diester phosphodiesterase
MHKLLLTKTSRIITIITLVLAVVFLYLFVYEPPYQGLVSKSDRILVFAHRGYGNHAPDNSLEGAKIAVIKGFDGVDVDAQFSKDREVIIFHDVSLERFTTETGRVDSKTVEELVTYDLAIKYREGFSDVYIKTFEDFVREITPSTRLMVELKVSAVSDTGIEKRVNEILSKYQAYDRVYVSSFNPVVLYRLKQIDSRIRTVFIFMDSGWDPKRVAETKEEDRVALPWYLQTEWTRVAIRKLVKPDAVSINYQVNESVIDKLLAKGYPVFLWSVNEENQINDALEKKPYGIVTDEPPLAKELRNRFEAKSN